MSGFNEESQMPEHTQGHVETDVTTEHSPDHNPSVQSTDRFGLKAAGKGYLERKYDIQISAAGKPYFKPMESLLKSFVLDAEAALAEARARVKADEDLQTRVTKRSDAKLADFEAELEDAGDNRAWLARSNVIWPMTDQVGYQLYKATSGEADLLDYASYLARTDSSVKAEGAKALDTHEAYQKRLFWTDLAYDELGVVDGIIKAVDPDSLDYNLEAIIRKGYQSAANLDTRNHLRGVNGSAPVTSDVPLDDFQSEVLASRRAASQAA